MNHRDERLGSAPLGKLMFSLAVPSVAAQLINVLYNIVDRIYIGHIPGYGDVALDQGEYQLCTGDLLVSPSGRYEQHPA